MSSTTELTPQPQQFFDLSGAFYAQKNFLIDLQNRKVTDETVGNLIPGVSNNLDNLYNNYQTASGTSSAVLTNQANMQEIVNTELNRLKTKKQTVDAALQGQDRMIQLNDSYRQKYSYYTNTMFIIVIFLIMFIIIATANRFLPDYPQYIFDILYFILALVLCFTIFFIVKDIKNRDSLNFSELSFNAPNIPLPGEQLKKQQQDSLNSGDLFGSVNLTGCVANNCCSNGTVWDQGNLVCVGASGFTTMSNSSNSSNSRVLSNYASEIGEYTFVN
jgi:hypothetical protein